MKKTITIIGILFLTTKFFYATAQIDNTTDVGVKIGETIWATRNVDMPGTFAANPESLGMLYQWSRNVGWSSTDSMANSNGGTTWDFSFPRGLEWTAENDPCPAGWRVPTRAELQSLVDSGSTWIANYNNTGINGRLFGTAPNQVFLPATAWRLGGSEDGRLVPYIGDIGYYWSATQEAGNLACTQNFTVAV